AGGTITAVKVYGATVNLTTSAGDIVGGGIGAGTANITAFGNIGTGANGRLGTAVGRLNASAQNIFVSELDAVTLNNIQASVLAARLAGGTITAVKVNGSTVNLTTSGGDIVGGGIGAGSANLTAFGNIGTGTNGRLGT